MTVRELITELQRMPQGDPVVAVGEEIGLVQAPRVAWVHLLYGEEYSSCTGADRCGYRRDKVYRKAYPLVQVVEL